MAAVDTWDGRYGRFAAEQAAPFHVLYAGRPVPRAGWSTWAAAAS